MLGVKVVRYFSRLKEYEVFGTFRGELPFHHQSVHWRKLDLTDKDGLRTLLEEVQPEIVIHCAANTNVDNCELLVGESSYLHAEVVIEFKKCKSILLFVYISTDSIFDGQHGDYTEEDVPLPLNTYALTKLRGEDLVKENFIDHMIIRTNIFGYHEHGSGVSITEWALDKFGSGERIIGFKDVFFNPIYTGQLAEVIYKLIVAKFRGVINIGSSEAISKCFFLQTLASEFSFSSSLVECGAINQGDLQAQRPLNTTLNISKMASLIGVLSLRDGLELLHNDLLIK